MKISTTLLFAGVMFAAGPPQLSIEQKLAIAQQSLKVLSAKLYIADQKAAIAEAKTKIAQLSEATAPVVATAIEEQSRLDAIVKQALADIGAPEGCTPDIQQALVCKSAQKPTQPDGSRFVEADAERAKRSKQVSAPEGGK